MNFSEKYELVIGLEVHAQLRTESKMFCGDGIEYGAPPNSQVSPVSLGHPGTLPVINKKAIELAVKLGIALQCDMGGYNIFARKNYFYPDLPKGYQITQDKKPICRGGHLRIQVGNTDKKISLNRIHLEEDAGKSIHDPDATSIDLNRAGTPLLEIVTEPCLHSSEEAYAYLTELRRLLRWIDVCDGNMEEGSMRCDANISVRKHGEQQLGTRVEVKNLNSIRNAKRAIDIEAARLCAILESGGQITQETRSFDADNNTTFALRTKEDANDYRYFPEPDLPVVHVSNAFIQSVKNAMPALPEALKTKYMEQFSLSGYDAGILTGDKETSVLFEQVISNTIYFKTAVNVLTGPVRSYCNEHNIQVGAYPLSGKTIGIVVDMLEGGDINFNAAVRLLNELCKKPDASPGEIAASLNLLQESDAASINKWVDQVLHSMPEKVSEYKKGKKNLHGMFAGQVKKISKGKADMQIVNEILLKKLNQ